MITAVSLHARCSTGPVTNMWGDPHGAPEGRALSALPASNNVLHIGSNFGRAAYARNASTAQAVEPWLHECQGCETILDHSSTACAGGR